MIHSPKSTLGGGLGIRVVGAGSVWSGGGVDEVDSTRPDGFEAGASRRCVRAGGAGMGGGCSTSAGNKVKAVEMSMAGKIVKAGGLVS